MRKCMNITNIECIFLMFNILLLHHLADRIFITHDHYSIRDKQHNKLINFKSVI